MNEHCNSDQIEQIVSVELEFFVISTKTSCADILSFIREHFPTTGFSGKCFGFWLDIPDKYGENPVQFKINGDGFYCSQCFVLECALPETNAVGAARLIADYIYPFLGQLEVMLEEHGQQALFLASTHDLHGHHAAVQFNADMSRIKDFRKLYQAVAPVLVSLPCITGPGGPGIDGYVRSVRLTQHCKRLFSGSIADLPLCYPRYNHFSSFHRAHENIEHNRLPAAIELNLIILSLVHCAYQYAPNRFTIRLSDSCEAARGLSLSLDNTATVKVHNYKGRDAWLTGLEIQEEMRAITESVIHEHGGPAWAAQGLEAWRAAIQDVLQDKITLCSDFQVKKMVINKYLAKIGLKLGDSKAQSAVASISRMLHRHIDPDEILAQENPPQHWSQLEKDNIAFEELKELYWGSLRGIYQFEIEYARIGKDNLVEQLAVLKKTLPLSDGGLYLAPRACNRYELMQKYSNDVNLAANWDTIITAESVISLGPPDKVQEVYLFEKILYEIIDEIHL